MSSIGVLKVQKVSSNFENIKVGTKKNANNVVNKESEKRLDNKNTLNISKDNKKGTAPSEGVTLVKEDVKGISVNKYIVAGAGVYAASTVTQNLLLGEITKKASSVSLGDLLFNDEPWKLASEATKIKNYTNIAKAGGIVIAAVGIKIAVDKISENYTIKENKIADKGNSEILKKTSSYAVQAGAAVALGSHLIGDVALKNLGEKLLTAGGGDAIGYMYNTKEVGAILAETTKVKGLTSNFRNVGIALALTGVAVGVYYIVSRDAEIKKK